MKETGLVACVFFCVQCCLGSPVLLPVETARELRSHGIVYKRSITDKECIVTIHSKKHVVFVERYDKNGVFFFRPIVTNGTGGVSFTVGFPLVDALKYRFKFYSNEEEGGEFTGEDLATWPDQG